MNSNRSKEAQEEIDYVINKYKKNIKEIDLINISILFNDKEVLYGDYERFVLDYWDISSMKLEDDY